MAIARLRSFRSGTGGSAIQDEVRCNCQSSLFVGRGLIFSSYSQIPIWKGDGRRSPLLIMRRSGHSRRQLQELRTLV